MKTPEAGVVTLSGHVGGLPVRGSPLRVRFDAGPTVALACAVCGDGWTTAVRVGVPLRVTVRARDTHGNAQNREGGVCVLRVTPQAHAACGEPLLPRPSLSGVACLALSAVRLELPRNAPRQLPSARAKAVSYRAASGPRRMATTPTSRPLSARSVCTSARTRCTFPASTASPSRSTARTCLARRCKSKPWLRERLSSRPRVASKGGRARHRPRRAGGAASRRQSSGRVARGRTRAFHRGRIARNGLSGACSSWVEGCSKRYACRHTHILHRSTKVLFCCTKNRE